MCCYYCLTLLSSEGQYCLSPALLKSFTLSPLPLHPFQPNSCCHFTAGRRALLLQHSLTQTQLKLRPLAWTINKQEVQKSFRKGAWTSNLHISSTKRLFLLLAASGGLQSVYLHLGNTHLSLQAHQQFTLTQKQWLFWVLRKQWTKSSSFSFSFFLLASLW